MRILNRLADKLVARVAPKTTADASTVVLACVPCGPSIYCRSCNGGPCACP